MSSEPEPTFEGIPVSTQILAGLVAPWLRPLIEQQIADKQAWCRLEAVAGPEAFVDLSRRIRAEYHWLVEAAQTMPYPTPPLALVIEAHVRRIMMGDPP